MGVVVRVDLGDIYFGEEMELNTTGCFKRHHLSTAFGKCTVYISASILLHWLRFLWNIVRDLNK